MLCLSISLPAFAMSDSADDLDYSEAYIYFSEQLAEKGVSANTCLEDFIEGYEHTAGSSLPSYVTSLIEEEVAFASALEVTVTNNLQYAPALPDEASQGSGIDPSSIGDSWYDNIGVSNPQLPQRASYNRYNILSTVQKGDIIHETTGGIAALTGHIAIVQGKYYDTNYGQYYIRTIEAVWDRVVYGVLDDTRYQNRGDEVYYVTSANATQKARAVDFCIGQLGKPWSLEMPLLSECAYESTTENWYCSELVWAAYYNQNINLHGLTIPRHIYTPSALAGSSMLTYRNVE